MSVIADLIRAGVDPELVGRVAEELAAARAEIAALTARALADKEAIDARRKADRERQSRSRHVTSRDVTDVTGNHVTSRDAGDAPAHESAPAYPEPTKTTGSEIKTPPSEGQKPEPKRKTRTQIAPDAQPTVVDRRKASEAGMTEATFRFQWAKFRDRHIAEGSTMADWSAAWRTWVSNWIGYGCQQAGINGHHARAGPVPPDQIRDPMIAAIQRRYGRASDEPSHNPSDQHLASADEL